MSSSVANLSHEVAIVWTCDIDDLDYVRSSTAFGGRRAGKVRFDLDGRLVGWAELDPAFKPPHPGMFERRFFWLKPYDRGEELDTGVYATGCPSEAVDPRTVDAGIEGELTLRSWMGGTEDERKAKLVEGIAELLR